MRPRMTLSSLRHIMHVPVHTRRAQSASVKGLCVLLMRPKPEGSVLPPPPAAPMPLLPPPLLPPALPLPLPPARLDGEARPSAARAALVASEGLGLPLPPAPAADALCTMVPGRVRACVS